MTEQNEQKAGAVMLRDELTSSEVVVQAKQIQECMQAIMQKDHHYGVIPGCQKPSLLQPGAEKLAFLFRLTPKYEEKDSWDRDAKRAWVKYNKQGETVGFYRAKVTCTLIHMGSGKEAGQGLGVSNNWEPKFISRDPYEAEETVLQFARKRAFVNAVRTALAASDIFTQDIEDMTNVGNAPAQAPRPVAPVVTQPAPKKEDHVPFLDDDTPPPPGDEYAPFEDIPNKPQPVPVPVPQPAPPQQQQFTPVAGKPASEGQRKLLWARAKQNGWTEAGLSKAIIETGLEGDLFHAELDQVMVQDLLKVFSAPQPSSYA